MTSGMPMDYLVIIEKNEETYGAYVPDLPGCVAAAPTRRDVMILIRAPSNFTWKGSGRRACRFRRPGLRPRSFASRPRNLSGCQPTTTSLI